MGWGGGELGLEVEQQNDVRMLCDRATTVGGGVGGGGGEMSRAGRGREMSRAGRGVGGMSRGEQQHDARALRRGVTGVGA